MLHAYTEINWFGMCKISAAKSLIAIARERPIIEMISVWALLDSARFGWRHGAGTDGGWLTIREIQPRLNRCWVPVNPHAVSLTARLRSQ